MAPRWVVRGSSYTQDEHNSHMCLKKLLTQTSKKSKDFVVGHCYCYLPNKSRQRRNEQTNASQELTILSHLGPSLDHLGTILDNLGPSWSVLGHLGLSSANLGQFGPKNLPKEVQTLAPFYTPNVGKHIGFVGLIRVPKTFLTKTD